MTSSAKKVTLRFTELHLTLMNTIMVLLQQNNQGTIFPFINSVNEKDVTCVRAVYQQQIASVRTEFLLLFTFCIRSYLVFFIGKLSKPKWLQGFLLGPRFLLNASVIQGLL